MRVMRFPTASRPVLFAFVVFFTCECVTGFDCRAECGSICVRATYFQRLDGLQDSTIHIAFHYVCLRCNSLDIRCWVSYIMCQNTTNTKTISSHALWGTLYFYFLFTSEVSLMQIMKQNLKLINMEVVHCLISKILKTNFITILVSCFDL